MAKRKAKGAKEAKERENHRAKEAKEKAKREAKEAKEKLKAQKAKEREKRKAKEAKEKAKREAKEAKEKAKQAKEKAELGAREAKKAEKAQLLEEEPKKAAVAEGVELYQGMVTLNIMPPIDFAQLNSLKEALLEIEDLRVVVVSGAVGEGNRILVSAEEPLPLLNILRKIPAVGGVAPKGDKIEVSLKIS